ncbi:hypothetical protein [[Phormidium] sp. ETS-05]|uniref:hypothetical protein n=1 Tax=[Phormidium] sp. ETS-05 TaxID=222819 RepID=UPI0018EF053D|nr:hypothetical protein [[Phormidium] sp. ETS-05]
MSKNSQFTPTELHHWQLTLAEANRHNIFCHCRHCEAEWVDSSEEAACPHCGSKNIERIACWQFPDD